MQTYHPTASTRTTTVTITATTTNKQTTPMVKVNREEANIKTISAPNLRPPPRRRRTTPRHRHLIPIRTLTLM